MGKIRSTSQQLSKVAHRATSTPPSKLQFTNNFKSSDEYSKRGNVLGILRPYWLRLKESEARIEWLKTTVKLELVVRDIDNYERK